MYGLERFKKAQSAEPFSIISKAPPPPPPPPNQQPGPVTTTQVGAGLSNWHPPDWAIDPRPGLFYLDVLKDRELLDRIPLTKRRHIFGRQSHTCDFVLDHQSVSRQHAAVVPHKNGSIFVIDLGSAHGTFVASERLTKDTPVELEVGQSLRFAASTRTYILRKNDAALFPQPPSPSEIKLLPLPDPSDEEAVVAYNTLLNRYGLTKEDVLSESSIPGSLSSSQRRDSEPSQRPVKRIRKARVVFRDQVGGELVELVGFSDGADVETEPGPIGVKEGSLVGKYESLVQSVVIPKGKGQESTRDNIASQGPVSNKLQELFSMVKATPPESRMSDGLYGDLFSGNVGSSWAYPSDSKPASVMPDVPEKNSGPSGKEPMHGLSIYKDENDDDLFGD